MGTAGNCFSLFSIADNTIPHTKFYRKIFTLARDSGSPELMGQMCVCVPACVGVHS